MNTNSSSTCPRCGSTLQPAAVSGLCPKCLLARASFATEDPTLPTTSVPAPTLEQIAAAFPELDVLELIGRGGMGVVYKARQRSLNRLVALKLLAPERVHDTTFAERFAKEAQSLAALSHPNIVTVHDFGHAEDFYFLLMEFVDGVNLRQAMSAGRFTPEQALAIVPPVCDALQYAHDHGIVHRDIKPENLLLDKDGRVKIADFGIAKMLVVSGGVALRLSCGQKTNGHRSGFTESGDKLGTPRYSAPEQRSDPQHVDHRADIYSLGVVLYELLTGEAPGTTLTPPSQRVEIDVRLDAVVLRALSEKPELRWQTAADLKTQVQGLTSSPATLHSEPLQRLYHAMGFYTVWGQRLLRLSLVGLLGFLGFVPGLEKMQIFSVFLLFLAVAGIVEKFNPYRTRTDPTPSRPWWQKTLTSAVIAIVIVIPLRAWVVQAFVINGKSLEPEMPPGSHMLVWKLGHTYVPGDIVAHRHGNQVWVSRVVRLEKDSVVAQRTKWPEETLPLTHIIGKVVSVYWRASSPPSSAVLKAFTQTDPTITKSVHRDGDAWRVDCPQAQVVRLFEFAPPVIDDCTITYRAKLKSSDVTGQAYLEMWCRFPTLGEAFSRGLDKPITGTNDWASYEIPFFLKKGEKPDLLKLNLSIQGSGRLWIKDVEVLARGVGVTNAAVNSINVSLPDAK